MSVTQPDSVSDASRMQNRKALLPTVFTEAGMMRSVIPVQPEKAYGSMDITESGIVSEVRRLHPEKAPFPMILTECAIAADLLSAGQDNRQVLSKLYKIPSGSMHEYLHQRKMCAVVFPSLASDRL